MGPPENPTGHPENQEERRRRLPCRPRMRLCLMEGGEQRFPPRPARQRYCSEGWKAGGRRARGCAPRWWGVGGRRGGTPPFPPGQRGRVFGGGGGGGAGRKWSR